MHINFSPTLDSILPINCIVNCSFNMHMRHDLVYSYAIYEIRMETLYAVHLKCAFTKQAFSIQNPSVYMRRFLHLIEVAEVRDVN